MKKISRLILGLVAFIVAFAAAATPTFADEEGTSADLSTSISISPVSEILSIEGGKTYDEDLVLKVTNGSSADMRFEVYAAPYSFTFSEDQNEYVLGFSQDNTYTQITRWIWFKNANGEYVEAGTKPTYTAGPGETVEVAYRIVTPDSIPAGGQYAVIFAHTLSGSMTTSGIKTEASPGLVIYARSIGETIKTSEISDLKINREITKKKETLTHINATAKVKNTGNVDLTAVGTLTVKSIFGRECYATPAGTSAISVLPETELTISDEWEETPYFGLFNVTWKIVGTGAETKTISAVILILPAPIIVAFIVLLTIITLWVIIRVKKRKARRSRYEVI